MIEIVQGHMLSFHYSNISKTKSFFTLSFPETGAVIPLWHYIGMTASTHCHSVTVLQTNPFCQTLNVRGSRGVGCEYIFHMSKIYVPCLFLFFGIGLNYKILIQEFLINFVSRFFFVFPPSLPPWLNKWLKLTRARRKYCNSNSSSLFTYFPASGAVTGRADISHITRVNKKTFPSSLPHPSVQQLLRRTRSNTHTSTAYTYEQAHPLLVSLRNAKLHIRTCRWCNGP